MPTRITGRLMSLGSVRPTKPGEHGESNQQNQDDGNDPKRLYPAGGAGCTAGVRRVGIGVSISHASLLFHRPTCHGLILMETCCLRQISMSR
jgi:hypothetical protein